jgi:hypothetical protein
MLSISIGGPCGSGGGGVGEGVLDEVNDAEGETVEDD